MHCWRGVPCYAGICSGPTRARVPVPTHEAYVRTYRLVRHSYAFPCIPKLYTQCIVPGTNLGTNRSLGCLTIVHIHEHAAYARLCPTLPLHLHVYVDILLSM